LSFTILTWIVATTWLSLWIQSIVISAYWAGWNIIQLAIIISIWLSMAMSVLIWQNAWAGHVKRVKKINKIWSLISFFLILFIWIIIFIFAPYFVGFFAKDKIEVIQIWSEMLRIGSLFFWFTWLQMALTWTLRAIWNTRTPMFITIIWTWAVKIPCAYLLSKYTVLWLKWIWWSEPIAIVVITILVLIVIAKVDWNHINITKEPEIIE
jgi:Na+-driven multidrug efflux pump